MRYASIDIGTNTILMLIGDADGDLNVTPLKDFYSVPRIGKSVSSTKMLDDGSISRAMEVLNRYRSAADDFGVERIVASATSAVRDAQNRNDFVYRVKRECRIDVEVIEGATEARLGYLGAVSGARSEVLTSLVIDIGGGSTEFSYGTGTEPSLFKSIDIGAVRITERFFTHNPPSMSELDAAGEFVSRALESFPFKQINPDRIFAVAGTATTLALIAQKKYEFAPEAVNNFVMSGSSLKDVFDFLKSKSPSEIRQLTNAAEGREDVLLAGGLILLKSLEAAGADHFLTTDRGLRYGYLLYKHRQFLGR